MYLHWCKRPVRFWFLIQAAASSTLIGLSYFTLLIWPITCKMIKSYLGCDHILGKLIIAESELETSLWYKVRDCLLHETVVFIFQLLLQKINNFPLLSKLRTSLFLLKGISAANNHIYIYGLVPTTFLQLTKHRYFTNVSNVHSNSLRKLTLQ